MTTVFQTLLNFKIFIVVRKLDNGIYSLNRFLSVQYSMLSQHLPMVRSVPSHTSPVPQTSGFQLWVA